MRGGHGFSHREGRNDWGIGWLLRSGERGGDESYSWESLEDWEQEPTASGWEVTGADH